MGSNLMTIERRKEVLEQLMNFRGHSYIQDYIQSKYEVGKKTVELDITKAYLTISNDYPTDTKSIVEKHIAMYYDLANDAKEQYDHKGAATIIEKIEKLLKLHAPIVAVQVNNNTLNLGFDQVDLKELKKLIKQ